MDSFHFHNIRVEKANKIRKHRRLQKVTALFRLVEVCVLLIILARSSTLFMPFAFKFSGEYIKGLFVSLVSPGSVFIIGNAIVIVLFLNSSGKSSSSSAQEGSTNNNGKVDDHLYDEYVASCQRSNQILRIEESKKVSEKSISAVREVIDHNMTYSLKAEKRIRRSRSENSMKNTQKKNEEPGRELRRSATETCLKSVENGDTKRSVSSYPVDEMSNEEFRCRVEAFIARQQRLLREEDDF